MNTRARLIGLAAGCGLLLAAFVLLAAHPVQAARPAPAADRASLGDAIIHTTTEITVYTVHISNEPPGRLIDDLYARLGDTNFAVALGYLKDHSNGIISQEWYDHLINDPASQEASLTRLRDYTSGGIFPFSGTVEVGEDGTAKIWNTPFYALVSGVYVPLDGRHFAHVPGWTLSASQNGQFSLTYAQDPAGYVLTHTKTYGSINNKYYTFAIAWREGYRLFMPLVVSNWQTQ